VRLANNTLTPERFAEIMNDFAEALVLSRYILATLI
jgi:hypothetical protein